LQERYFLGSYFVNLSNYIHLQIAKLVNPILDLNPDFIKNFLRDYACTAIYPALVCAAVPGSLMEKHLQEFFTLKFAPAEREWLERQLSTVNTVLEPCANPHVFHLDTFILTNIPIPSTLAGLLRVAPYLVATCAFRSGITLTDAAVETISHSKPTHMNLNRSVHLTDLGFAAIALRMTDTLRVLSIVDSTLFSDASYTAIGQLRVLQRLVLEVLFLPHDSVLLLLF
jgi:hypothetical protein